MKPRRSSDPDHSLCNGALLRERIGTDGRGTLREV